MAAESCVSSAETAGVWTGGLVLPGVCALEELSAARAVALEIGVDAGGSAATHAAVARSATLAAAIWILKRSGGLSGFMRAIVIPRSTPRRAATRRGRPHWIYRSGRIT